MVVDRMRRRSKYTGSGVVWVALTQVQLMCFDLHKHNLVGVQTDAVVIKLPIRIEALVAVPVALVVPIHALIPAAPEVLA